MKKKLLFLAICSLFLGLAGANAATRMVVLEYFGNTSCGPCAPADPYFDQIADNTHVNTTAAIHFHTWWPSTSDPFYQANIPENTARTNYYSIPWVPYLKIDGVVEGAQNYTTWDALVTSREAVSSPLTIDLDGTFDSGSLTGTINALATAEQSLSNLVIQFILTETDIYWPAPNGVNWHRHIMRDMLPNATGEAISFSAPGDTVYRSRNFTVNPTWNILNLEIVVFIQNASTKEVLQGAKWQIPMDVPNLSYVSSGVNDILGNGDGRADPGETVDLINTLENGTGFQDATSVTGTLSTTDPTITITKNSSNFSNIPAGGSGDNSGDPFAFSVNPSALAHKADFTLDIQAQPNNYTNQFNFTLMIGRPEVLLVDDDIGKTYETYFRTALDDLSVLYDEWNVADDGDVGSELHYYHCIVWFTGNDTMTTLTAQDQTDLATFLDGGGTLLLTGQSIGEDIGGDAFYFDYLHALYDAPVASENILEGVPGDVIGNGLNILTVGSGGAGNQNSQDIITPMGSSLVFQYTPTENAAVRYDSGTYKVVYYAFGLEGIHKTGSYAGRDTLIARSLGWLGCAVPTVGVEEEDIGKGFMRVSLLPIQPNPLHNSANFVFQISAKAQTSLKIYDLTGQLVKTLVDGVKGAASYRLTWDLRSNSGTPVPSGVYFATLTSEKEEATQKIILVR